MISCGKSRMRRLVLGARIFAIVPESPGAKPPSAKKSRNPKPKMLGTKMAFPGLKDPKQIDDIVAYLEQLRF
jgi:hypothetical protein